MSRQHRRHTWWRWEPVRRAALDRDGWRCRCGSPVDLEVHHVVPLDKGGDPFDLGNLRTMCRDCHISLHLDPQRREWRAFVREGGND